MFTVSFPGLNIGPFVINDSFSVFGWFDLRFYSTIIALGMVLAVLYAFWRFKENGLKLDTVLDYAVWLIPIGIVGARLYYVIFDMMKNPDNYLGEGFWKFCYNVIAVWEGGLAIYGGVILGGLTIMVIALIKKTNPLKIIDIAVPSVMFAQCIGRWGNFFNFEAFGEATTGIFRMCMVDYDKESAFARFSHREYVSAITAGGFDPTSTDVGVHPTFLYESLWNLLGVIIMIVTLIITTKILKVSKERRIEGFFFSFYMIWYGSARMIIETLRTDSLYLGPFRVSVLVAIITLVIGVLLMAFLVTRNILQRKKNIDIWTMFKSFIKKKFSKKNSQEVKEENGTNN
ncbi:MAG: prolipoprotein diacylglyceryl transferase [Clostridia bacterium]|nr:prolipoprotein diacylglyceryl transferase [Clostridia bacterium]